jgi:kynureninase
VPALYAATAGYDLIEEIGVERIRERSVEQTTLLIDLLEDVRLPVTSPRDAERRGGTVGVRPSGFERIGRELLRRDIVIDWRPDVGLRLGPHYFNSDDELRYAVDQIAELAGQATSLRA